MKRVYKCECGWMSSSFGHLRRIDNDLLSVAHREVENHRLECHPNKEQIIGTLVHVALVGEAQLSQQKKSGVQIPPSSPIIQAKVAKEVK